jgi:hypothetical protein
MPRLELSKEIANGPAFSATRFFESLTDALPGIGAGSDIKKALVGLRILHDRGGLPLHRQYYWTLASVQLLHEVTGAAAERGQRMDILRDIEHDSAFLY